LDNLVDIVSIIKKKKEEENKRLLDIEASLVCLNTCLEYVKLNNLPELEEFKKVAKQAMVKLKKSKDVR
jgi:hypothetical protein